MILRAQSIAIGNTKGCEIKKIRKDTSFAVSIIIPQDPLIVCQRVSMISITQILFCTLLKLCSLNILDIIIEEACVSTRHSWKQTVPWLS
nr:hypothetical protein CFP56_10570 [Quercus suber]